MCGIVGVLANNGIMPVDYDKIFSQLLVADILRGDDSTGVLSVVGKKRLLWQKCAYDGYSFSISAPFQKLLNKHKNNHKFLLGHNRAATTGKITEDSAHPFIFDKVAGVHNGTMYNFGKWDTTDPGLHAYEVDSQQLYYLINKYGPDTALKECSGSWALVWVNLQDKTLNFLRNSQRPLWFAHTTAGAIYWASEKEMLEWILARNKVNVQRYEMLPEYTLVSYKINNSTSRTDTKNIGRPRIIGHHNSNANWGGNYYEDYTKPSINRGYTSPSSQRALPHKTTESSKSGPVQEDWKWERPVDFTKSYTARITHTETINHQLVLVGHVFVHSGVTPEKFIVYGGVAADFVKWHSRLLTVKLQYRNKTDKHYVTRIHEVGPYKPAKESSTEEPIEVRGDSSINDRLVRGPGGLFIPVDEFCDSVAHGCMNCGDPIQVSEANDLFWSEDTIPQPICPHCVELWEVFSRNYERLTTEH